MGYIPDSIDGTSFPTLLTSFRDCLDVKGTLYYNRIAGGMKYDNSDLLKLELVVYLLNFNTVSEKGLDCIFDEQPFPGLSQLDLSATAFTSTGYLQSFVNFAKGFCKDCITSTPSAATSTAAPTYYLFAEDGVTEITLESGGHINLQ